MKIYFSSKTLIQKLGHANYAFVDINVQSDQRLFIDPNLILVSSDPWCVDAARTINSYFDHFYAAYRYHDRADKGYLLSHAQEVNATRLGYGRGDNGHGNTSVGLMDKFACLDTLVPQIQTINSASDLPILIPDFDQDGLSDLITNVICKQLYEFTAEQLALNGIKTNTLTSFYSWDSSSSSWQYYPEMPAYAAEQGIVLLVPKGIVCQHLFCNVDHFFRHIILSRLQQETAYLDANGKLCCISKKDLVKNLPKTSDSWKRDTILDFTQRTPDSLTEYHDRRAEFYSQRPMSDSALDLAIYGKNFS